MGRIELLDNNVLDFNKIDTEFNYIDNLKQTYWNCKNIMCETEYGIITSCEYELEHDGYDFIGPKSNIHHIKVQFHNGITHDWFREYWFNGDDDELYERI